MPPEAIVQRQVDAYNARDLASFIAVYSDTIKVFRPPATQPSIEGRAAFAEFYATQRFNRPGLHAQIVNRMIFGNKVIDHERISGVREQPFEVAVVYAIVDGMIATVWNFPAEG